MRQTHPQNLLRHEPGVLQSFLVLTLVIVAALVPQRMDAQQVAPPDEPVAQTSPGAGQDNETDLEPISTEPVEQSGDSSDGERESGEEPSTQDVAPSPAETPAATVSASNPCEVRTVAGEARLDKYRREIFETVCETAARFDGFFGSRRFDEEARRTHGRAGLRFVYDEHDKLDIDADLDVNVNFPNLDDRLNAFLGRKDRTEFVTGSGADLDFLPTFFESQGGEEWLIGLGYRPVSSDRSSVDLDVGADVDSSIDPFVRARYRAYWLVGDDNLLRARQTVYYSEQKRLGSGTRLDFERPFGKRTLARWSGNVIFDAETEGAEWDSGVTMFHGFSRDRAVSWYVGIDGESGKEVPIENYGTRITYRQRMLREWFFGEVITGVTWPRDNLQEQRELAFHLGFGFQIQFSGEDLGIGRRP